MAVAHVTLAPSLRAWASAGVSHLLFEHPVQISAHAPAAPASVGVAAPSASTARGARQSPVVPVRGVQAQASPSAPSARRFASRSVPPDPAAWDAPWNQLREKAVPAPIVWTYHELGADMTGVARSAERSGFFRQIIADLQLRKGSSSFWPCSVPRIAADGSVSFESCPAYFAAGIDFLLPQLVVVFGRQALNDIGLDDGSSYFSHLMVEGKLVVILPEVSELLHGTAQRASSVSLLRAVVTTLHFT